jgi:ribosomal protein S18 acetylase RimI-like enzyme
MALKWIHESPAKWDEGKEAIVGESPEGIFDRRYSELTIGELVPGEWWRVEDSGVVVGYGWLDLVWGDAEILLATAPSARNRGVGSFILTELENEARHRGVNYIYNVVRPTHPSGKEVTDWLLARGFELSKDGSLTRSVSHA